MLLLIEDDYTIAKGIEYFLKQHNFSIIHISNVLDAISFLKDNSVDLILLDITLPDGNGFELYENTIKHLKIPVIFLTARDTEDDIVKGFSLGGEDYITKPFLPQELLVRIEKVIARNKQNNLIIIKNITFDMNKMVVYRDNKAINFTSLELKILLLLLNNVNRVVSRENITYKIWEWTGNDVYDNTITVYLKRIRDKLQTDIIKTINGIGYRIDYEK